MKNTKFKRIQCIDRALDILNAVVAGNCRTVNDIASHVGLNQATVYNIVKTLESRGFIDNRNGCYGIGSNLGLLASNWDMSVNLPLLTKPILEEVSAKTGEAACVTILNGLQAEIVNLSPGIRQVSVQFLHRFWSHPLNLGTGRLLIALGNSSDWPNHIHRHLQESPRNRGECNWDYRRWEKHLNILKAQDFVILRISPELEAEEIGAVAVPLRSANGAVIGVIGSSCPLNRASDEHLLFMKDSIVLAIRHNPI